MIFLCKYNDGYYIFIIFMNVKFYEIDIGVY